MAIHDKNVGTHKAELSEATRGEIKLHSLETYGGIIYPQISIGPTEHNIIMYRVLFELSKAFRKFKAFYTLQNQLSMNNSTCHIYSANSVGPMFTWYVQHAHCCH